MAITTEQIKDLREKTGAGVLDCREALTNADGNFDKAVDFLREKGLAKAAKRADREALNGVIELYSHGEGRVGVMAEVNCETDFVALNESFREFAHEIALQIAAMDPKWISDDQIPDEIIQLEMDDARIFAKGEGKPENVIEKIVEGRLEKFKDDNVLLRQTYIRDDSMKVQDLLNEKIAFIGENILIRRFERWELGGVSDQKDEEEET
ncbi:MAG: translation elongation factor Ts [Anaerolineales bacterium]|jgi:elongation factor Ts